MSNDRLEELLQDWTAARINFSSKHSNRSVRLWKLINQIPESHRVEPFSTGDEKTKPPHYVHRAKAKLRRKLDPHSKVKRVPKKAFPKQESVKQALPPMAEIQATLPYREDQQ